MSAKDICAVVRRKNAKFKKTFSCNWLLKIYGRHPELQSKWDKSLWTRGFYVSIIGNIMEDAIRRYIQEQSEESRKKAEISFYKE